MKKIIIYIIIGLSFFGLFYLFSFIAFLKTEMVCARVKELSAIKGREVLVYTYKYKGKQYNGNFDSSAGISMRLDVYKDRDCVEVEVSTMLPFMSRIKKHEPKNQNSN